MKCEMWTGQTHPVNKRKREREREVIIHIMGYIIWTKINPTKKKRKKKTNVSAIAEKKLPKNKKKFTRLYNGTLHRHNSHFLHLHSRIIFFFGSTWNSQTHVTCSSSSSKKHPAHSHTHIQSNNKNLFIYIWSRPRFRQTDTQCYLNDVWI